MRTHRIWLVALILPVLMASMLVAQIPTSMISGRVINEGQGLPGVTVTAKSPALQGTRTAVTSTNGDFVFPNLPPGDYTISFTMSGFQTVTRTVKANAAQQAVLNAQMSLAAVAAEAVVVGTAETVSQTTQNATTYSSDLTKKLPVTRTLLSSVLLAPGASTSQQTGNTTISGGQTFDNLFMVNGVNVMDNIRGTPNNLFIEDAIAETTTSSSGISAEYGRFTGGVINAITKSGGNNFSGSFRVSLDNDNWNDKTPFGENQVDKTIPTYEGTLGGPIWKDKVWFFAAGRLRNSEVGNQTRFTNIPFAQTDDETRLEGKLTVSPFQNHTFTGSYLEVAREQGNYYYTPIPILTLDQLYTRQLPQSLLALNYNGVLTDKLFVEAQYSQRKFEFQNSGALFTDLIGGTAMYDLSLGAMYNSPVFCGVCSPEQRNNEAFLVKGTYFLSTKGLGSHNIVLGYEDFTGVRKSNNYQSGNSYWFYSADVIIDGQDVFPIIDSSSYLEYWPIPTLSQGSNVRTYSFFLNDTWRLNNNFSFNVGVRYDKNDAQDSRGATTADDAAFSPRLGATWDVFADGRLRFNASYARYVGGIQENQVGAGSAAGNPAYFQYYYEGPEINTGAGPYLTPAQTLESVFRWYGITGPGQYPTNKTADAVSVPGVNVQFDGVLKSPYVDEFTAGIAGSIGTRGNFRVDGVYRSWADFYGEVRDMSTGQVTDSLGNVFDLSLVKNENDPLERTYYGLQVSGNYRIFDSLNIGGNWTYSHLYGNVTGETSGSGPVRTGLNYYTEYRDLAWAIPTGDLPEDQRHRVRIYGGWDAPLPKAFGALNLSIIQTYDTGQAYSDSGTVRIQPYVTNPGYRTPPTSQTYYFSGRGANQWDDVWRTDLQLNYSYFFGPVELFLSPQVFNAFNNDAQINGNTLIETNVNRSANYAAFNPFTTTPTFGARNTGANWGYGPSYGQATASTHYQTPRTYRVSVGVRF
ncbi:MAG: TonB-dependent receptor [Holophagales bacterium]|nr:TonB-dependent receptor [Holophagales bacterium]